MRKLVYVTPNGETTEYTKGAEVKLVVVPDEITVKAHKLFSLLHATETRAETVKALKNGDEIF